MGSDPEAVVPPSRPGLGATGRQRLVAQRWPCLRVRSGGAGGEGGGGAAVEGRAGAVLPVAEAGPRPAAGTAGMLFPEAVKTGVEHVLERCKLRGGEGVAGSSLSESSCAT